MIHLTERQQLILSLIIDYYIDRVEPVSSKVIMEKLLRQYSSATIRNEMSELEKMGLITHPHTSAGRLPTDIGYRYYLDYLLPHAQLDPSVAYKTSKQLLKEINNVDVLIENASKILATFTGQAGLISLPDASNLVFKRLEIYQIDDNNLWLTWITNTGFSTSHLLEFDKTLHQDQIKQLLNYFNQQLSGFAFVELPAQISKELKHRKDSLHHLYDYCDQIVKLALSQINQNKLYIDGSSNILQNPEFQSGTEMTGVLKALERRRELMQLMRDFDYGKGICVRIGAENQWQEIQQCSLISTTYSVHGKEVGVIGVLGPRRMNYAASISYVELMANQISNILERWI